MVFVPQENSKMTQPTDKIRVLVVDDTVVYRKIVSDVLLEGQSVLQGAC